MSELHSVAQPAASGTADILNAALNCNTSSVASSHTVITPASRTAPTFSYSSTQPSTPHSTASASATPTASASPALVSSSSSLSPSAASSAPSTPILSSSTSAHTPSPAALSPASSTRSSSSSPSQSAAPLRSCLLRLSADQKQLEADPPEGIDASPLDPSNLLLWRACLFGPADSEWEGAVLSLSLSFLATYPLTPPAVRFSSRIFHPNVFPDGSVCLDIIAERWSPAYTVSTVLTSIQSLLCDPNPASPANLEAARLWAKDKKEYRRRVRACVAAIANATH